MPVSFTENKHKVQEWYQRIAPRGTVVNTTPHLHLMSLKQEYK